MKNKYNNSEFSVNTDSKFDNDTNIINSNDNSKEISNNNSANNATNSSKSNTNKSNNDINKSSNIVNNNISNNSDTVSSKTEDGFDNLALDMYNLDMKVFDELKCTEDYTNLKEKFDIYKMVEGELSKIRKDLFECGDKFIKENSQKKPELGKIISWLGDTYTAVELIGILETSHNLSFIERFERFRLIKNLLNKGYKEVSEYTDERYISLVSLLNSYENFIDTFDSIEITQDSNCIDKHRYIISPDLHNLLISGYKDSYKTDRTINKNSRGIYVVTFSLLNDNTLVYKFIKYPYLFKETLLSYVISENTSMVIGNYKSIGVDYLFVLDTSLEFDNILDMSLFRITEEFKFLYHQGNSRGIYPRNVLDLYKILIQGRPVLANSEGLLKYVTMCINRSYYELGYELLNTVNLYVKEEAGLKMLENRLNNSKVKDFNLLNKSIFIVEDLDSFIKGLKNVYNTNPGPQKWRGQNDSLSNNLSVIDNDFRKSLNRHNQYHVNVGNISRNNLIGRSRFSFQNVHINLGNVRWISSKSSYTKQKVTNDSSVIFNQLRKYLENLPINEDTQRVIEEFLLDYSYISLRNKESKTTRPTIDYSIINSRFVNLLKSEEKNIIDYINRSRNISFTVVPKEGSKLIQYYTSIILKELDDDYILSLIYGRILKIISNYKLGGVDNTAVDLFYDIATDLINNYYYMLYKKSKQNNKDYYTFSDWKSDNEYIINNTEETKIEIGASIINWIKNIDIIKIKLVTLGVKERYNIFIPTDKVLKSFKDVDNLIPLPRKIPMIVKPKPYYRECVKGIKRERLGGYLLNDDKFTDTLIIHKWSFKEKSFIKDINVVYDMINNINSVGYKINKNVLNFIYLYGIKYDLIIPPKYEHPLSKKDKLNKLEYVELHSFLSKKELQNNILGLVEVFLNVSEFFLPVRIDFRGRLYCISEHLNYQSTELAKSLLIFSKPEKVNKADIRSINYLKAYGANCFGNKLDKKSWSDRIKWVDNNIYKIINFRDGELIKQAENKLLFIAFCFEYNRFIDSINNSEATYFETYLPIQLDATCNGYQHLSLLSLDHNLAKELNLTKSNWDDEPKDFYSFTGVKLISYFKDRIKDISISEEEKDTCIRLSNLDIARVIIKKAIMTIPYNITHLTMIDYIQDNFIPCYNELDSEKWYCFKGNVNIKLKETDFAVLARGLKKVLNDDQFKIKKLLDYLNEVAKICTKLDLYIPWTLPSGVLVRQSYVALKEVRLKAFSYSKKTFTMKIADNSNYMKTKQVRAFMPNLIHSLDATSLALLVDYYFNNKGTDIKNIYSVHDCFAVTCNNVDNLLGFLKLVYYKIYSENNYLRQLDKEIIHHIKLHYGDSCFDDEKLEIKHEDKIIKYPSIEGVLGLNSSASGLILDSSYLAH